MHEPPRGYMKPPPFPLTCFFSSLFISHQTPALQHHQHQSQARWRTPSDDHRPPLPPRASAGGSLEPSPPPAARGTKGEGPRAMPAPSPGVTSLGHWVAASRTCTVRNGW
ncbi:hypothetical protein BDY17DRAFT_135227 [Neohortaea acidophila]|uniref:Uncharacterized protein n=1 Tax=Neohortaea acidophila TaxID=245834 RepID=A0A6A6Q017_9PEZI|nr:uncharacterized protein BDY17DRAFT_135227 [Neohortaea acidophila]KAF2484767.1 hypothetical protein BDY17DRAFT_135227 [Neohortaea acidophila]